MLKKLEPKQNQGFWEALYSSSALSEAITWITQMFAPEDIYESKVLEEWARDNDFIKKGEGG